MTERLLKTLHPEPPNNSIVCTHAAFQKHFWHFMSNICAVYHLDTPFMLLKVLRLTNAVLGGSCALYVFCPTPIWPSNLDFYLPKQYQLTNALSTFLLAHGYCLLLQRSDDDSPFSDIVDHCEIYIHQMTKRAIRLVYANCHSSPLAPLLDAHSTLVLNYISWESAVCLYPTTTLKRIGIRMQHHIFARNAFENYMRRGFVLRPQFHHCIPGNLYDFSTLENRGALILSLHEDVSSPETSNISWILPSDLAAQREGCIILNEDGFG